MPATDTEEVRFPAKQIVVFGSGFGVAAAAVRLAARGHRVTLLEKRDQPDGRAYVYRQEGFTSAGGPTVITAPCAFEQLFALAGQRWPTRSISFRSAPSTASSFRTAPTSITAATPRPWRGRWRG